MRLRAQGCARDFANVLPGCISSEADEMSRFNARTQLIHPQLMLLRMKEISATVGIA